MPLNPGSQSPIVNVCCRVDIYISAATDEISRINPVNRMTSPQHGYNTIMLQLMILSTQGATRSRKSRATLATTTIFDLFSIFCATIFLFSLSVSLLLVLRLATTSEQ